MILTQRLIRDLIVRIIRRDLSGVDLQGANLRGVDLTRYNLTGVNFFGSSLEGADLRNTKLRATEFAEAMVRGANFFASEGLTEKQIKDLRARGAIFDQPQQLRLVRPWPAPAPDFKYEAEVAVLMAIKHFASDQDCAEEYFGGRHKRSTARSFWERTKAFEQVRVAIEEANFDIERAARSLAVGPVTLCVRLQSRIFFKNVFGVGCAEDLISDATEQKYEVFDRYVNEGKRDSVMRFLRELNVNFALKLAERL